VGVIRRVAALFYREKISAELDEELRYHLTRREELNKQAGIPEAEARLAARRSFGNVNLLKERTREIDLLVFIETFLNDLQFAARMLAKHPSFTVLGVLALAVGIGVNTAVFTACKAVLLQSLDAKDPGQLVNVYRSTQQQQYNPTFSYPDFEFYRDHNHVFTGLVATTGGELAMTAESNTGSDAAGGGGLAGVFGFRLPGVVRGSSEFVSVLSVSEDYFAVLGENAIRGRVFLPQDTPDLVSHPAMLISENFWRRRFAQDPSILGKSVKLNGSAFTIIGITPHDFLGTNINVPNIWLPMRLWPLALKNATVLSDREETCCALYGRLQPGISLQQAQADMNLLSVHVRKLHSPHSEGADTVAIRLTPGSHIMPLSPAHDSGLAFALLLILCAVGLVLLIACANVSSLQLARSVARQREIGVRLSLGASRLRIIRQLLTESALMGVIAGIVSLCMTWWLLRLLMLGIAASLPAEWGSLALHLEPDLYVFAYVFLLSVCAGVIFGLVPALQTSRPSLSSALKEEGSGFALYVSRSRLRDLLVATQAAASVFLLIGAGLLIHGSIRSILLNPGYETKLVTGLDTYFPAGLGYTHEKQLAEVRRLIQELRNTPDVKTVSQGLPPDGGGLRTAAVGLNGLKPSTDKTARTVFYSYVAPNYFECLGIPLVIGNTFSGQPTSQQTTVILSQSAATEFWPGQNPIGKRLALDASNQFHTRGQLMPQGAAYEVIGVAKDTRAITPQGGDDRKAYLVLPTDQEDSVPILIRYTNIRKDRSLELGKRLRAVDPNLIVYAETLEGLLTSTPTFVITRLAAIFASLIGGLGLLLACVGIYGTVGYAVTRRTREIGIRMALGAFKTDVLRLIILESSRPVALGLIVGVVAAAAGSHLLQSLLFGLGTLDPIAFGTVALLFLLISLLAAYLPARRATQVDPAITLRYE
jgi:predicted permease